MIKKGKSLKDCSKKSSACAGSNTENYSEKDCGCGCDGCDCDPKKDKTGSKGTKTNNK